LFEYGGVVFSRVTGKVVETPSNKQKIIDLYKEDAEAMAKEQVKGYVDFRPGQVNRCNPYCICRTVCNQYKKLEEEGYIQ
jgi:hypothetical protein